MRFAQLDGIVQQKTIPASHHFEAVGDETSGFVLSGIVLPILFRPLKAEQDFGDRAVAFSAELGIESAQRQDVKLAQLRRHDTEFPAGWTAVECTPEAASRMSAQFEEAIRGQAKGVECRCIGHRIW